MVRLKPLLPILLINDINLFQFLYGAIKTPLYDLYEDLLIEFQFLYGAIKTVIVFKNQ